MKKFEDYTQEELTEFDGYVQRTLLNLYSKGKENENTLVLNNFNPKDKSHLYLLEIAYMAHNFYGFSVFLNCKWYQKLFNRNLWGFNLIKRPNEKGICIEDFLNFSNNGLNVNPITVYELYYADRNKF